MKKTYPTTRFLSWLLIAAMLCSFAVPIRAVGTDATALSFHQTDDYVANLLTEEENAELLRLLNKLRDALK